MRMSELDITPDELMVCCMARQIQDGEIVVQGLATPMAAAAYLLARATHAPNIYFGSAIGQSVCREPAPLGLTRVESLWLDRAMMSVGFVSVATDLLPNLHPKEFFRPGQVDINGNFNNLAFGSDFAKPRLRLPGSGGIPDVTLVSDKVYLYVPRHSRVTFVTQLDFCSGLGHNPARTHGAGPQYLITDLGQFDFAGGRLRLTSLHPGVSLERVKARTGFDFEVAAELGETSLPDPEVLRLLREEIDPLGIRRLEALSGGARRELLEQIIAEEAVESRL